MACCFRKEALKHNGNVIYMRSEVMGKTLAMFMVIAMIATGIAMLPTGAIAAESYTLKGKVLNNIGDVPLEGVTVIIDIDATSQNETVYTNSAGEFSKVFMLDNPEDFTVYFGIVGFGNETRSFDTAWYDNNTADTLSTLLFPQDVVEGTVYELDSTNPIGGVEVTIDNNLPTITDPNGKFFNYTNEADVDLCFNKNGYYSSSSLNVIVSEISHEDIYYMEKIVPTPTVLVNGIVYGDDLTDGISGAQVSISEGDDKWITAISDETGYYKMSAYPGNYQIMASADNYLTTFDESYFFTVSNEKSEREYIQLIEIGNENVHVQGWVNSSAGGSIDDAVVKLHRTDGKYVNDVLTYGGGYYSINITAGNFTMEVSNESYFTNATTSVTAAGVYNVELDPITQNFTLSGFVFDREDDSVIVDADVTLYSKNYLFSESTKTGANGYYEFNVSTNSNYTVVVDADGYQSEIVDVNSITDNIYRGFDLYPSGEDTIETTYTFIDWNSIQVKEFKTLSVDNITARYTADRTWGMGDLGFDLTGVGTLDAGEVDDWATYLEQKGAEQRDTADFLTLDNLYYELEGNYTVTIDGAEGVIAAANTTVYINGTYNYVLVGELEDANADTFQLTFNSTYDNLYEDFIFEIYVPDYEMTENITETNNVEVTGYNNPISINPEVFNEDFEEISMTLKRSMNGTAMASIVSGDHYYVVNSTYDNYTVIVAQGGSGGFDTIVKFSAEDSTDLIGDINKANFTWTFGDGTFGWGMNVEHNFTAVAGDVTVTLKITETGGNETTRDLFIKVDSQTPSASISVITTDADNVSVASGVLTVNEDTPLVFSGVDFNDAEGMGDETIAGGASVDEIKDGDGNKGTIEKWFWSWGEDDAPDETITMDGSNNITHTYSEPGTYYLNLITTDVVGHESATANWTVKVIDKTAPMPEFKIVDNVTTVTEVVENVEYAYNASLSTDNIDDVADLVFSWIIEIDDKEFNYTGETITFTFSQVGEFNVTLFATDSAGNKANSTQIVHVNLGERPNILMKVGSMVFDPEDGTAGSSMKITVNLTNDGKVDATNIQVTFYIRNDEGDDAEIGTTTISTLAAGDEAEASITWTPGKKGDYSIWANATCAQEHKSQYWDNSVKDFSIGGPQTITIAEASWVLPAIALGIIAVVIVVFFGFRYFMQRGVETDKSGEKRKKR